MSLDIAGGPKDHLEPTGRQIALILLISGALGFRVGVVAFADWQDAVEPAQVVAGLVHYPVSTPFFVYQTKLWTILHQLLAIFLRAGVSEITLSTVVSGVLGAVSFQALSVFVYALARNSVLAIGAPLVILYTHAAEYGVMYPIWLLGAIFTYGIIGLSVFVLAAALLGAGAYRTGAFVLGVAPAVHPSLGAWLWLIVAISLPGLSGSALQPRSPFRRALPFFLAGAAVAVVSFAIQWTVIYQPLTAAMDSANAERYLSAFVTFWDMHRQPVRLRSDGLALNIAALVIAALWLTRFAAGVPRSALFLLRFVTVTGVLSLMLTVVSRIPPARLPASLLILMPGRVLNVNAMTFAALLLGILGIYRRALWSRALMLALIVALIVANRSMYPGAIRSLNAAVVMLIAMLVLIAAVEISRRTKGRDEGAVTERRMWTALASQGLRLATVIVLVWVGVLTWRLSKQRAFTFLDRTNDLVFQMISQREGLLLTGGDLHMIQLRTRRPVLLDGGALDALPYTIEAAPEIERILRDVYSIDFFNPPPEARFRGSVPSQFNKAAWEGYALQRWETIAQQYGVTQVVTPGDWELKLPIAVRNRMFTVYDIPHASP